MTIHCEITCSDPFGPCGWIEVDPVDYEYEGADPDGEIETYLRDLKEGEITHEPADFPGEYPPRHKTIMVKETLQTFDPIWLVHLPDDFE